MSMTISRNATSANILKELKEQLMSQTFICQHQEAMERESLPSLLKSFFQNHSGLIAALNCKRQYLIIFFTIITVIIEHLFM